MLVKGLADMPRLRHTPEGKDKSDFDINDSELMGWIMKNKYITTWVFNTLHGRRLIEYNRDSQTWSAAPDLVSRMARKVSKPVDEGNLTTEQAYDVLAKNGAMKYKEWRMTCETERGIKINHWSFWHVVRPLVESSRVFKAGVHDGEWQAGTAADRLAAEEKARARAALRSKRAQEQESAIERKIAEIGKLAGRPQAGLIALFPASDTKGDTWASIYERAQAAGIGKSKFDDARSEFLEKGLVIGTIDDDGVTLFRRSQRGTKPGDFQADLYKAKISDKEVAP